MTISVLFEALATTIAADHGLALGVELAVTARIQTLLDRGTIFALGLHLSLLDLRFILVYKGIKFKKLTVHGVDVLDVLSLKVFFDPRVLVACQFKWTIHGLGTSAGTLGT